VGAASARSATFIFCSNTAAGLARLLVQRAKGWCRAQGCSAVSVALTGEARRRLSAFYTRLGFELTGRMSASAVL
jgi:GNAT superfamily N-acetyltransferase